jgi:hypothetical protein
MGLGCVDVGVDAPLSGVSSFCVMLTLTHPTFTLFLIPEYVSFILCDYMTKNTTHG